MTKGGAGVYPKGGACICVAAPIDIRFGKISRVLPVALINQRQNPSAICTGLGTKKTIVGIVMTCRRVVAFLCIACDISLDMPSNVVLLCWFVKSSNHVYGFVKQMDQMREGVTKEARNTADHIDSRSA